MIKHLTIRRTPGQDSRRGIAAVEMAVCSIMIVTMLVGMMGTAQFIMMNQIISNASRTAARDAVRTTTTSDTQVTSTVQDYLERTLPSVSTSVISGALTVNVLDANGGNVSVLSNFAAGDELAVQIQFSFDAVS